MGYSPQPRCADLEQVGFDVQNAAEETWQGILGRPLCMWIDFDFLDGTSFRWYDRLMALAKLSKSDLRKHKGVSFTGITTVFFCYDDKGRLFLARRTAKARDEHGRWDPGAGGLKHGQTLEANVRRELKEEYGAEALRLDFIGYRDVFRELDDGTPTHWLAMDFAAKVDPDEVCINEPEIFDDHGWFALDQLPSPLHSQMDLFMQIHGDVLKEIMARP